MPEKMVKAFEYDRAYSEWKVNLIRVDFHEDFCQLRREMISEGLMDRDGGRYWRLPPQKREESL